MKLSDQHAMLAAATQQDKRWAAVLARDPAADGQFYYSVSTTGVYCKPSCAARAARPEHVAFHPSCQAAEAAGFRPCKRCRPGQPSLADRHAASIAAACRRIQQSDTEIALADLATGAGISTYHFHRIFKAVTGLTPKAFARAERQQRVRTGLHAAGSVTEAVHAAGYGSSSRFYESSSQLLGMTPSCYRAGGANSEIRFAVGLCSLGSILVARSEIGVCAIFLGEDADQLVRDLQDAFPRATLVGGDLEFERFVSTVVGYVQAPASGWQQLQQLPLDIRGTAFQERVWQALRAIPPGVTVSYTEIARRIGAPKAVRAVASACAANTLALAIPCHRVVRTDGSPSGYRWGVQRKRALLALEKG